MTTTSIQTRVLMAFKEFILDRIHESVSPTDIIIFVIGSTGVGKSTFINKAFSDAVMPVPDPNGMRTLQSCAEDVKAVKCGTSPWNPFGRNVIFAEIPAFNHSNPTIQRRIPDLIKKWLSRTCCAERPIDSGIIYLHSMATPRLNEDFKKHLHPFVKLCNECGHRPTSVLLVSTQWFPETEAEVYRRTTELEELFRNSATSLIPPMPYSIRFDESQISARNAIDLLILNIQ